jgi:hypothetical protein
LLPQAIQLDADPPYVLLEPPFGSQARPQTKLTTTDADKYREAV